MSERLQKFAKKHCRKVNTVAIAFSLAQRGIGAYASQHVNEHIANNPNTTSANSLKLAIDDITGEVFIGTDKGIISYKGTATEGGEVFNDVYAYPNPVHSDYDGPIAIKGLV